MKHFLIFPILILVTFSFVLSSCSTENIVQVPDENISSNVSPGSFTKLAKTKKWPPDFIIDTCFGYGKITFDTTFHKFKDMKDDVYTTGNSDIQM
ncbi:MAG: hypothetical protein HF314_03230 [Ignavibacteria bacterium]|jgi:hypothetical protein|nr:hypothetical protein [Ignavibacteria bacterium]MCU7502062.1 hypothetical protein [Ignavibacteria bacterium]MCU7515464.1 hypothetical protein [Ignavibacteria bacterium]